MSSIGGLDGAGGGAQPASTGNAFDAFTSEDFLELIFSELTNQDPLQPNDTGDLINQIGQIRSIEADVNLADQLDAIVSRNEIASAGNLVGSYVVGTSESGLTQEGLVLSVSVTADGPVLNLHNNSRIALGQVQEFVDPDALDGGGGQGGGGQGGSGGAGASG